MALSTTLINSNARPTAPFELGIVESKPKLPSIARIVAHHKLRGALAKAAHLYAHGAMLRMKPVPTIAEIAARHRSGGARGRSSQCEPPGVKPLWVRPERSLSRSTSSPIRTLRQSNYSVADNRACAPLWRCCNWGCVRCDRKSARPPVRFARPSIPAKAESVNLACGRTMPPSPRHSHEA